MCQVYSSIMISQQRRPHYPFSENTFGHKSEFYFVLSLEGVIKQMMRGDV